MSIDKTKSEQLSDEIKIEELSREIEIEQFIKKMKEKKKFNNEMLSYNMVINGRWGDGKTTFLKQIEEHIKNNKDLGIDSNNIIKISA
jgi:tRNA A37 threonylcarbamoyladenosine biosynthesis protein TsaE